MRVPGRSISLLIAACLAFGACVQNRPPVAAECRCTPPRTPTGIPYSRHPTYAETGFIPSPYAPNAGLIDVRSYPAGTRIRYPFTGKTFVVPPHGPYPRGSGQKG
jgi:hypothetical protein